MSDHDTKLAHAYTESGGLTPTHYVVTLRCDPGEDGTPTREEIAKALGEIEGVRETEVLFAFDMAARELMARL